MIARRVRLPVADSVGLRVVVSGDPHEAPGRSDFLLRVGVLEDGQARWLLEEAIDAGDSASEGNWRALRCDLSEYAGRTATLLVCVSYGGPKSRGMNEEAFFDEISVVVD